MGIYFNFQHHLSTHNAEKLESSLEKMKKVQMFLHYCLWILEAFHVPSSL